MLQHNHLGLGGPNDGVGLSTSPLSTGVFQPLTVKLPFVGFCVTKFNRTFSNDISKKKPCSKLWPPVVRGPLSSRGPIRTYAHVRTVLTG